MFIDTIKNAYGINTPIFEDEILNLFKKDTHLDVSRLVEQMVEEGKLILYSKGVYFIPKKTFFGQSTICSEMVAKKKYVQDNKFVYGIYAGLNILNAFGVTTQVPSVIEIVTNNETTEKRKITIKNRAVILHKSRCTITKYNYHAYTIVQLFYDMNNSDRIDSFSKILIDDYVKKNNITKEKILSMLNFFPSIVEKRIIKNGVINISI